MNKPISYSERLATFYTMQLELGWFQVKSCYQRMKETNLKIVNSELHYARNSFSPKEVVVNGRCRWL
jgi:hypothetical protein